MFSSIVKAKSSSATLVYLDNWKNRSPKQTLDVKVIWLRNVSKANRRTIWAVTAYRPMSGPLDYPWSKSAWAIIPIRPKHIQTSLHNSLQSFTEIHPNSQINIRTLRRTGSLRVWWRNPMAGPHIQNYWYVWSTQDIRIIFICIISGTSVSRRRVQKRSRHGRLGRPCARVQSRSEGRSGGCRWCGYHTNTNVFIRTNARSNRVDRDIMRGVRNTAYLAPTLCNLSLARSYSRHLRQCTPSATRKRCRSWLARCTWFWLTNIPHWIHWGSHPLL